MEAFRLTAFFHSYPSKPDAVGQGEDHSCIDPDENGCGLGLHQVTEIPALMRSDVVFEDLNNYRRLPAIS